MEKFITIDSSQQRDVFHVSYLFGVVSKCSCLYIFLLLHIKCLARKIRNPTKVQFPVHGEFFLDFFIRNLVKLIFLQQKAYYIPNKVDTCTPDANLKFTTDGFENCPDICPVVKLRNLSKKYNNKEVVRDFSLDIFPNQITVLLGHNGAGKTTTMCMLAGLIPKSNGQISVDGMDNVNFYRSLIGYCPQHNIFLPYLTCKEHLEFFGQVRIQTYQFSIKL